jgi:hypothetical protein
MNRKEASYPAPATPSGLRGCKQASGWRTALLSNENSSSSPSSPYSSLLATSDYSPVGAVAIQERINKAPPLNLSARLRDKRVILSAAKNPRILSLLLHLLVLSPSPINLICSSNSPSRKSRPIRRHSGEAGISVFVLEAAPHLQASLRSYTILSRLPKNPVNPTTSGNLY